MCGIIGIVHGKNATVLLLDGLATMEYRGYDSAGLAVIGAKGVLQVRRSVGKLAALHTQIKAQTPMDGATGIGHTRWATHGRPSIENAHPHFTGDVALVHNGIIENYDELRAQLDQHGYQARSETDSETIAHFFDFELKQRQAASPREAFDAFTAAIGRLQGAYAVVAIAAGFPGRLFCAANGASLCFAQTAGGLYVASDPSAIVPHTDNLVFFEDGDLALLDVDAAFMLDAQKKRIHRTTRRIQASTYVIEKGRFPHYMAKEIAEQPESLIRALTTGLLNLKENTLSEAAGKIDFSSPRSLVLTGCGTAYYSARIAACWFEDLAGLVTNTDIASELRYRKRLKLTRSLCGFISQSGETADTIGALKLAKQHKNPTFAVLNAPDSTLDRHAETSIYIQAGKEIGVASTKAFTAQLLVLACLALTAGKQRGCLDPGQEKNHVEKLVSLPGLLSRFWNTRSAVQKIAEEIATCSSAFFIGRGIHYPLACEGALKLKEISYIHAEGYAAGELKHGPLALIEDDFPVIVLAPYDRWFPKTIANMQEISARGGKCVLITDERGADATGNKAWRHIVMPSGPDPFLPILYALPIQLLAYYVACKRGANVDQPRNLAKSVTVE